MDFSYLDREEYKNIPLHNENDMNPFSENKHFFIRKYKTQGNKPLLHRHSYIQINYVYKGIGYHIVNNRKIEISKGDIFVIPPYVPHSIFGEEHRGLEIFEFEFVSDFVLPTIENSDNTKSCLDFAYLEPFIVTEEDIKLRFKLDDKMQNEVEAILWEAAEEYKNQSPGYILVSKALLLKLLVIVGRAYSCEIKGTRTEEILNKYKSIISKAAKYIESNYDSELTLEKIAGETNYSKSRFCYLFKAVMGRTYIEYLNEVRISRAKELLQDTEKNISDISFEVGYKTIANFNKYFKLLSGITPKQYRKNSESKQNS